MNQHQLLPAAGYVRLNQIIGQSEITDAQARKNKELNAQAEAEARSRGHVSKNGKAKYQRRPTKPRPAIPAIIPVSRASWLAGVKSGRYPQPVRILGPQISAWNVNDILALVHRTAA